MQKVMDVFGAIGYWMTVSLFLLGGIFHHPALLIMAAVLAMAWLFWL